jgi:hypothetical protein
MENSKSIINFMYFGHNYPHNFIAKAWAGKETLTEDDEYSLADHLTKKFHTMYEKHGTLTFFRWYMELDNGNKEILNDYIADNYNFC